MHCTEYLTTNFNAASIFVTVYSYCHIGLIVMSRTRGDACNYFDKCKYRYSEWIIIRPNTVQADLTMQYTIYRTGDSRMM